MEMLQRYGNLIVMVPIYRPIKGRGEATRMICLCLLCGNPCTPVASNVRGGRTTSCGNHYVPKRKVPANYDSIHRHLNALHGSASNYECKDCQGPANEWSYNGNSPYEEWGFTSSGRYFLAWSPRMQDYSPRCLSCHRRHDKRLAKERNN